jgi:hypothetical protein
MEKTEHELTERREKVERKSGGSIDLPAFSVLSATPPFTD